MKEIEKKEKIKIVQKIGVLKLLSLYNNLCKPCKIKSIAAVRRGGKSLNNIVNEYCPDCKKALEGLNNE